MMDITTEFYETAAIAWACGLISVMCAIEAWRQQHIRWQAIGCILAALSGVMCPATLTRGYYDAVLANQQLASLMVQTETDEQQQFVQVVQSEY